MYAVEVKDLVKNYGSFQAIKGISFKVREGEVYGLIGPNGAGKTTALRILSTLLEITAGEIKIYGIDLRQKPDEVRRIISYLPEDAGAYKNLTGRSYLKFIAQFFAEGEQAKELVSRGLEIANLDKRIDDKVETYSKGMARRLLVARALMIKPKLAILDELTSGLDVINAQEIRRTVKLFASQGTTMLLSSHNMLEVELLCDRITLINDGEIVAEGTPDELKERYGAKNIEEVFVKVVSE
ncbi:MAG: ABC transporter ATP-binding protein [Methanomassiliicoccus sp.]|nr:MAG: ABC transporter ATP-binding protein [Methanomassiliicoccus sp.]